MNPDKPVPVTILTGFLGAGKTTLLNYILRGQHGYKFAMIVNEIGEIGIDGQLVENVDEEMVQLSNGCVCCTIRKDLIKGVQRLLQRGGFDYLLIETTGIADPGPVAQTFLNIPQLAKYARLDSIITVVDAEQIDKHLRASETASEQIAAADFILLNKTDLVEATRLDDIETVLKSINPHATLFRTSHAAANLGELLDMNAFDLDRKLAFDPRFLDELKQHHHGDIRSTAFQFDQPFNVEAFELFVAELSEHERIFRSKGILAIAGNPRRAVFHGVNDRYTIFWDRLWKPGEERVSQLVFIGRGLDDAWLRGGLLKCLA